MTSEERWRCFLLNVDKFLGSRKVLMMTPEQVGGYIILLCHAWKGHPPGTLPDDDAQLAVLSRLGESWQRCSNAVRAPFKVRSDGLLESTFLSQLHEQLERDLEQKIAAGRASAEARKSLPPRKKQKIERTSNAASTPLERSVNEPFNSITLNSSLEKGDARGKPNPLWDAVCLVFGLKPATKSDRSRLGKVVADLKAKSATPEDVPVRAARYKQQWPTVAFTPEALVKHWDTFARDARPVAGQPQNSPARVPAPEGKYAGRAIEC